MSCSTIEFRRFQTVGNVTNIVMLAGGNATNEGGTGANSVISSQGRQR